tara:strand:- start:11822 stop:16654 length:4833 start_codon:yes stop_codon:yes gene_type:complete
MSKKLLLKKRIIIPKSTDNIDKNNDYNNDKISVDKTITNTNIFIFNKPNRLILTKNQSTCIFKKNLIIRPVYGLGNRLRALASSYSICKSLGLNLIINWVEDNHCNCSIHSLISNIDDIGFIVNEEVYINNLLDNNYKIYNYIETEMNGKKDEFIDFDKYKEVFVKSNCIINSKYSYTNYNSFFKVIKFSGRVNYLINSLETTNLIGMHIRMEGGREYCNSSYDNYKNWTEKETKLMFENRERSHINYFANQIKIILEKDPSKKFFIATDMKSNYDKLIKFYGSDKIKILERNVFDRSSSQIEYALADIILLSKCNEFYGSSWSSFSEIVIAFQCRYHSKKVCNTLSNDFQRKINGIDLNMKVIDDIVFNNKNAYNCYKNLVNEYESLKDKFNNYNLVLKVNIYCLLENLNLNLLLEENKNLKKLVLNKVFTQDEVNRQLKVLINNFYNNKKFINNKYLCNICYYLINKNINNISINVDLFNKIKKVINAKTKNNSVLVIGNGPSAKNFKFNSYKTTLTMNNFYRYSEKIDWYSNIYVSLDVVVTESNIKKIKEMIDNKKHELYYLDDIFLKFYPEYKDNELTVFRSELKDIDITFSDESLVTTGSDSVRLMLICNFTNVNVIGVDCNYKRENNQLISGMKVIKTTHDIIEVKENINNPNYFFEGYHVKGDKLNFPDCRLKENLQKHGNDLHYLSWVQLIEAIKIFNENNFKKVNIKSLSKNSTSITNFINDNIDMKKSKENFKIYDLTVIISVYKPKTYFWKSLIENINLLNYDNYKIKIVFVIFEENLINDINLSVNKDNEIINLPNLITLYEAWNHVINLYKNETLYFTNWNIDDRIIPDFYRIMLDSIIAVNGDVICSPSQIYKEEIDYDKLIKLDKKLSNQALKHYCDSKIYRISPYDMIHIENKKVYKNNLPNCLPIFSSKLLFNCETDIYFDNNTYDICGDYNFWVSKVIDENNKFYYYNDILSYQFMGDTLSAGFMNNNNKYKTFIINNEKLTKRQTIHSTFNNLVYINNFFDKDIENRITIVIPVHNVSYDIIDKCITNIIVNDEYLNINIIVVFDSEIVDYKEDIIQKYSFLKNVKLIFNDRNYERCVSRNIGLEHTITKYVMFLDVDDILIVNNLNNLLDYIKKVSDCNVVCGTFNVIYSNKREDIDYKETDIVNNSVKLIKNIELEFFKSANLQIGTLLFDRDFLVKNKIFWKTDLNQYNIIKAGEDIEFLTEVVKISKIHQLNVRLINYVKWKGSSSHFHRCLSIYEVIERRQRIFDYLENDGYLKLYILSIIENNDISNVFNNKFIDFYSNIEYNINDIEKTISNLIQEFSNIKLHVKSKYIKDLGYYLMKKNIKNINCINEDLYKKVLSIIDSKFNDKKVLIMGSGPSLKNFNFRNYDITITMNNFYRYSEEINWYSNIYVSMDSIVTKSNCDKIKNMIDNKKHELYYLSDNFHEIFPEYKYNDSVLYLSNLEKYQFKCFGKQIITTGSDSARLLIMGNYTNINLIGIDCNYNLDRNQKLDGVEEIKNGDSKILKVSKKIENNENYFFNNYQLEGDTFNYPDPLIKEHLEKYGKDLHYLAWEQLDGDLKNYNKNYNNKIIINNLSSISKIKNLFK